MKVITTLIAFSLGFGVNAQIEVKNTATFKPYVQYGHAEAVPSVIFRVTVINNTDKPIPDIDVSNRSEFLNFFVNGENNNPISMYNGIESTQEDHLIHPGESDIYEWMWLFKADWKLEESYGKQPVIHWTYKGIKSNSVQIDIANQKEIKPQR